MNYDFPVITLADLLHLLCRGYGDFDELPGQQRIDILINLTFGMRVLTLEQGLSDDPLPYVLVGADMPLTEASIDYALEPSRELEWAITPISEEGCNRLAEWAKANEVRLDLRSITTCLRLAYVLVNHAWDGADFYGVGCLAVTGPERTTPGAQEIRDMIAFLPHVPHDRTGYVLGSCAEALLGRREWSSVVRYFDAPPLSAAGDVGEA